MGDLFDELESDLRAGRPVALATVVEGENPGAKVLVRGGDRPLGTLGDPDLDRVVVRDTAGRLESGQNEIRHYGAQGQPGEEAVTVFIEVFAPPPRMLIFGAVDFTGALASLAKQLGYHVTVCDAREVFATEQRFPMADEVVVGWPNALIDRIEHDEETPSLSSRDAVCILTHDPKFDVPAAVAAFATDAGYIGAMGSRRTTENRAARLRDEGVAETDLDRLHAPIGLDLGARTPEEVAVSILAEIISTHTGRVAPNLRDASGPLH